MVLRVVPSSLPFALAIALAACGSGGGSDYEISIEPTSGPGGTRIAYTFTGCEAERPIIDVYKLASGLASPLAPGTFKVVAEGKGRGAIVVPEGTPPGEYGISAVCDLFSPVSSTEFTVTRED